MDEIFDKLAERFHPKQVHWRIGQTRKRGDGYEGKVLAYLDARDVMDRLDSIVGPENWEDYYAETSSGRVICSLTLRCSDDGRKVTKSDGAGSTGFEGEKGAISDAFKRAAVKFGIGRYLYSIDAPWVTVNHKNYGGKDYYFIPDDFDGSKYLEVQYAFSSKQAKTRMRNQILEAAKDPAPKKVRDIWSQLDNDQRAEIWGSVNYDDQRLIREALEATKE